MQNQIATLQQLNDAFSHITEWGKAEVVEVNGRQISHPKYIISEKYAVGSQSRKFTGSPKTHLLRIGVIIDAEWAGPVDNRSYKVGSNFHTYAACNSNGQQTGTEYKGEDTDTITCEKCLAKLASISEEAFTKLAAAQEETVVTKDEPEQIEQPSLDTQAEAEKLDEVKATLDETTKALEEAKAEIKGLKAEIDKALNKNARQMKVKVKKNAWTDEERKALREACTEHGPYQGCKIFAKANPTRSAVGAMYQWGKMREA